MLPGVVVTPQCRRLAGLPHVFVVSPGRPTKGAEYVPECVSKDTGAWVCIRIGQFAVIVNGLDIEVKLLGSTTSVPA